MLWVPRSLCLLALLLGLVGCGKAPPQQAAKQDPEVLVAKAIVKPVTDYELFTGRTEASAKVDLRARVGGTLEKTNFTEGEVVEKDRLLFLIDQRPYKVALDKAAARLAAAQASAALAQSQESRALPLLQTRALSREEYDKFAADVKVARANILEAEADLAQAKLDLEWTEVRAPFAGRIGRWAIDPGNMVKADDTLLATIGTTAPVYVTFDADERTVLRQLIKMGPTAVNGPGPIRVEVGLVDEPGRYPHPATVNFYDSRLDGGTGSLWMRATFDDPSRLILPGMFSRVRFPLGAEKAEVCVSEQALSQNQGERSLYVIDAKTGLVVKRSKSSNPALEVGRQHGGLRVIKKGVEKDELVVVSGLQRIREGIQVRTKILEKMPGEDVDTPPDEPMAKP